MYFYLSQGAERFSSYSGSGPSAQFSGEFWDISEVSTPDGKHSGVQSICMPVL